MTEQPFIFGVRRPTNVEGTLKGDPALFIVNPSGFEGLPEGMEKIVSEESAVLWRDGDTVTVRFTPEGAPRDLNALKDELETYTDCDVRFINVNTIIASCPVKDTAKKIRRARPDHWR